MGLETFERITPFSFSRLAEILEGFLFGSVRVNKVQGHQRLFSTELNLLSEHVACCRGYRSRLYVKRFLMGNVLSLVVL